MLIKRNIKGFERLRAHRLLAPGDLVITDMLSIKTAIRYATLFEGWSTLEDVASGQYNAALVTRPYFGKPVISLISDGMPDILGVCVLRPRIDCPYLDQIRAAINRRYLMDVLNDNPVDADPRRFVAKIDNPFAKPISRRFILNPYHSKPIPL